MRKLLSIILAGLVTLLCACVDETPSGVLSESKMEDILFEYHLAQSMSRGETAEESALKQITYRASVLRKYGVTQEEWDSSLVYYCRHADRLYEMYQRIGERCQNEIIANGGDAIEMNEEGLMGDTANVWAKESNFIMMHIAPYNVQSFVIETDTSYQAGDRFTFSCETQFLFEDGMHDLLGVFAITLGNDSVITNYTHSSMDGRLAISLSDDNRLGIKSLKGYLMVAQSINEEPHNALRLVAIRNARLVRMHTDSKVFEEKARQDSIQKARQDSLNAISGTDGSSEQPMTDNLSTNQTITPNEEGIHHITGRTERLVRTR